MPEMMLSSMSDPSDASDDAFMQMANLPTKAGETVQEEMRAEAEKEVAASGKVVDIEYKVTAPSSDVKTGLLQVCRLEQAGLLLIGPGVSNNGTLPLFVAAQAKGLSVCVVRDQVE